MKLNIYEQAVIEWGTESQINMAIEECAELICALQHYARGKTTIDHVADEIADVEIMMAQLRVIVGSRMVDVCKDIKTLKLNRMLR